MRKPIPARCSNKDPLTEGVVVLPQELGKKVSQNQERSQKPLWFAIAGLVVSVFSYSMSDLMVGDVVFWIGLCFAAIALIYWYVNPRHGLM